MKEICASARASSPSARPPRTVRQPAGGRRWASRAALRTMGGSTTSTTNHCLLGPTASRQQAWRSLARSGTRATAKEAKSNLSLFKLSSCLTTIPFGGRRSAEPELRPRRSAFALAQANNNFRNQEANVIWANSFVRPLLQVLRAAPSFPVGSHWPNSTRPVLCRRQES